MNAVSPSANNRFNGVVFIAGRRVIEERRYIDGKVYVTLWTYDAMDRVTSTTYPDGEVVNYTYNAQLLLDSMIGSSTYVAAGTGYNAAGQPTSISYNGVVTTMVYHAQTFRLTSISAPGLGLSLGYSHFPNGNISQVTDGQDVINLGYDDLDRMASASGAFTASYTIDQIGRMLSKTEGVLSHSYQYADPNHKHAPSAISGVGRVYDANGNLSSHPSLGEGYEFNPENHLVKITVNGAYAIRMGYDGDGRRAKRVDALGTVHYPGPHYERNVGTGADTTEVITKLYWAHFGPYRRLIAVRRTVVGGASDLYFLHHDHLGSTKAITGTAGGPYKYYPFGWAYQEVSNPPTDSLYTGQKRDLSTGLYFYGARYYNPAIGMFVQPDSIVPQPGNPQSLNRYSYGLNNPLRYTDPTGHEEEEEPYYIFVGGYGTTSQSNPSDWGPMINNLGLKGEGVDYGFFEWQSGWSGKGTASIDRSTADAAPELARQIGQHKNVTLVGHSKGGALIMEYLAEVAEGRPIGNRNVKRAFTIDSPLDGLLADSPLGFPEVSAQFRRFDPLGIGTVAGRDRLAGLPGRLVQKRMTVDIANLDNPNDWFGSSPIPGISYRSVPLGDALAGHFTRGGGVSVHGLLMASPQASSYVAYPYGLSGGW